MSDPSSPVPASDSTPALDDLMDDLRDAIIDERNNPTGSNRGEMLVRSEILLLMSRLRSQVEQMKAEQSPAFFTFPPPQQYLGGCNCAFKAPTPPTCRDQMEHLADCPAKGSGYPVGAIR